MGLNYSVVFLQFSKMAGNGSLWCHLQTGRFIIPAIWAEKFTAFSRCRQTVLRDFFRGPDWKNKLSVEGIAMSGFQPTDQLCQNLHATNPGSLMCGLLYSFVWFTGPLGIHAASMRKQGPWAIFSPQDSAKHHWIEKQTSGKLLKNVSVTHAP